jgi:hypothetical protein
LIIKCTQGAKLDKASPENMVVGDVLLASQSGGYSCYNCFTDFNEVQIHASSSILAARSELLSEADYSLMVFAFEVVFLLGIFLQSSIMYWLVLGCLQPFI